jgi:hypothetical protein
MLPAFAASDCALRRVMLSLPDVDAHRYISDTVRRSMPVLPVGALTESNPTYAPHCAVWMPL